MTLQQQPASDEEHAVMLFAANWLHAREMRRLDTSIDAATRLHNAESELARAVREMLTSKRKR